MLDVLGGQAQSITVEDLDDAGHKSEFTLLRGDHVEVHQVKRQRSRNAEWKPADLHAEGLLTAARDHVLAGRQFHFASMTHAPRLRELADVARGSATAEVFLKRIAPDTDPWKTLTYIQEKIGTLEVTWKTLKRCYFHSIDEDTLDRKNTTIAGLLFDSDAPAAVPPTLRMLIEKSLSLPLDREAIIGLLPEYKLRLSDLARLREEIRASLPEIFNTWQGSVARELITPHIPRPETAELVERLRERGGVHFVTGDGGSGKSAVLHDAADALKEAGWTCLAFRLDRESEFSTSFELGHRYGLGASPVSALGALSEREPTLLVIDQLDAVSHASGRMPAVFAAVESMLKEASAFPNMRVLIACRKFDLENDSHILSLLKYHKAARLDVPLLTDTQVRGAVEAMGIDPAALSTQQVKLLGSPFALKLLSQMDASQLSFSTLQDLQETFWAYKSRACDARKGGTVRFATVVRRVALAMSQQQRLTVPSSILDEDDLAADGDVLVSEGVLVKDGRKVSFFHESFFDYAFARQWCQGGQTLVAFLTSNVQELFRRSQVRQILVHLRLEDPERFLTEVVAMLRDPGVRFHLKQVALAVLRMLEDPTAAEWEAVKRLATDLPELADHLWWTVYTAGWFARANEAGDVAGWLQSGNEEEQTRAVRLLQSGTDAHSGEVAALLSRHAGVNPNYPSWLRAVMAPAAAESSRPLFDLMLQSVRRGEYDGHEHQLFVSIYQLREDNPAWAIDLIEAYWVDRPDAVPADPTQPVSSLDLQDHAALELITTAAAKAPHAFVEQLLPFVVRVLQREAELGADSPSASRYWLLRRLENEGHHHDAQGAMLAAARESLQAVVASSDSVPEVLVQLADIDTFTAQWLLYQGLAASKTSALVAYALSCLLGRANGLVAPMDAWTVRDLIAAIAPQLSASEFDRLETAVLNLRPDWEKKRPGHTVHVLLDGLPRERLARPAVLRLEELQRRDGVDLVRSGVITGGWIPSPIPSSATPHMTDAHWLGAMARYTGEREDRWTFKGGAHELAAQLNEEVKRDPTRFGNLALRLTKDHHAAYASAILRGLGENETEVDAELTYQVIRHLATFDLVEVDRWLSWPLRHRVKEDLPDDIIAILIDRALTSSSPAADNLPDKDEPDAPHDDLLSHGINCVRGSIAEFLGDYVVYDTDGSRTAHITPQLPQFAAEPTAVVKSCSAHLLAACLRYASADVLAVADTFFTADDRLLVSRHARDLMLYQSHHQIELIEHLQARMASSPYASVRYTGGQVAAYLGLEHTREDLLRGAAESTDPDVRRGVADVAAIRLRGESSSAGRDVLVKLFADPDEKVRESAATVAMHLRDRALQPFTEPLKALIESPAFRPALPQLFITLEHAPDRVHDLIVLAAQRFLSELGTESRDIRTAAAGDAHYVGGLVMRAYQQAASDAERNETLDLVDGLLRTGSYGIERLLSETERLS
ncbi:hypothetical protein ACF3NS_14810 [Arsenicicoccus cauae]|uniref:hypothetical protein n=1 Tax=Arsenicicoccus cauae TaxID=2663847 RepID=UPI00370D7B04